MNRTMSLAFGAVTTALLVAPPGASAGTGPTVPEGCESLGFVEVSPGSPDYDSGQGWSVSSSYELQPPSATAEINDPADGYVIFSLRVYYRFGQQNISESVGYPDGEASVTFDPVQPPDEWFGLDVWVAHCPQPEVDPPSSPPAQELPDTGTTTLPIAVVGLGAAAIGTALVGVSRRVRHS